MVSSGVVRAGVGAGRAQALRRASRKATQCHLAISPPSKGSTLPAVLFAGAAASVSLLAPAGPAMAARVSAPFEDVSYIEVPCAKGANAVGLQGRVTCLEFSGDITNPDKKNAINTADVFGRVYDKAGNGLTDTTENDRIAFVDLIPPGKSRVTFNLSVGTAQYELGAISWKGLKVTGFTGKVLPGQAGLTGLIDPLDCSNINDSSDPYDIEECENQALESAIR